MNRTQTQPMTAEQLWVAGIPEPCELIDGELRIMSPAGRRHGYIAGNIHALLWNHVKHHRLGEVYAAETGYVFREPEREDTVLAPDVSFIAADRLPPPDVQGYIPFAPDLAVEVVSPGDRAAEVDEKIERWLGYGVKLLWVVWPNTKTVTVHRSGRPTLRLEAGESLDGGEVIPGFACDVSELFD